MAQNDIGNFGAKTPGQMQLTRPQQGQNEIAGVGNNAFNRSTAGGGTGAQSFLKKQQRSNQRREDITRRKGMQDYANTRNSASDTRMAQNDALVEQQQDIQYAKQDFQEALAKYVEDVEYQIRTVREQMAYEDQQDQLAMRDFIGETGTSQRGAMASDFLQAGAGFAVAGINKGFEAKSLREAAAAAGGLAPAGKALNSGVLSDKFSAIPNNAGLGFGTMDQLKGTMDTAKSLGQSDEMAAMTGMTGGRAMGTQYGWGDTVNRISPVKNISNAFNSLFGPLGPIGSGGQAGPSNAQQGPFDSLPFRDPGGAFDQAKRAGLKQFLYRPGSDPRNPSGIYGTDMQY